MNTVPFTGQSVAAVATKRIALAQYSSVLDVLKIAIIRGAIENSDPQPKCGNF
jgi:hypothetical protein